MAKKPPINLAAWQWALIGSGSTLLLASAAYGAFNLISNPQGSGGISKNSPTQIKSADPNISPTASNASEKVSQNFSNIPVAGTWLIKTTLTYGTNGVKKDTFEVVITNDGRVILPDLNDSSRGIESATNIRRISTNTNVISSDVIAAIAGTWVFEVNNESIRAVISNDGVVAFSNPNRAYQLEEVAKIIRKVSNNTTGSFANIITFADLNRETMAKIKQSEARTYVDIMNKKQQAFYTEKARFASSFNELETGTNAESNNYSYRVSFINNPNPPRLVTYQIGQAKRTGLKSYIGAVRSAKQTDGTTAVSILCETDTATTSQPPLPILVGDNKLECAAGTKQI
jgi:hypothetical protein